MFRPRTEPRGEVLSRDRPARQRSVPGQNLVVRFCPGTEPRGEVLCVCLVVCVCVSVWFLCVCVCRCGRVYVRCRVWGVRCQMYGMRSRWCERSGRGILALRFSVRAWACIWQAQACRKAVGAHVPAKIQRFTLMCPIHGNL